MTRLNPAAPVRALKNSRRALTGKVTLGGGEMAGFESSLERDWLRLLDFDPNVIALREQPFTIYYEVEGRRARYTPDVLAEYSRGGTPKTVVYEVKPLDTLRSDWLLLRPRFKAAVKHCRARGWQFRIVTEQHIRTPLLANATFLRRYKAIAPLLVKQAQLKYTATVLGPTTPQALLAAAYWPVDEQAQAIPALWQLVASGEIEADLSNPLTMATPIRLRG